MFFTRKRAWQNVRYGLGLFLLGLVTLFVGVVIQIEWVELGDAVSLAGFVLLAFGLFQMTFFGLSPILKTAIGGGGLFSAMLFLGAPTIREDKKDANDP